MVSGTAIQQVGINKTGLASFGQFWRDRGPDSALVAFFPEHLRRTASYYCGTELPKLTQHSLERLRRKGNATNLWICVDTSYDLTMPGDRERHVYLTTFGPGRDLGIIDDVSITEVTVPPISRSYPEYELGTRIDFSKQTSERFLWDGWYDAESRFRWSKGQHSTVLFGITDRQRPTMLRMQLSCFHDQHITVILNDISLASLSCANRSPHLIEASIPAKVLSQNNTLEFILPDATSPHEISGTRDRRKIAIGVYWLELR
jgi:hypothetical protein